MDYRKATHSDIEGIAEVFNQSWPLSNPQGTIVDHQLFLKKYTHDLWVEKLDTGFSYVAVEGNTVEGFSLGLPSLRGEGILHFSKLFLLPQARGKKVGSMLHDLTLEEAQRLGYQTAELNVFPRNWRAQGFYLHRGWHNTGYTSTNGVFSWLRFDKPLT